MARMASVINSGGSQARQCAMTKVARVLSRDTSTAYCSAPALIADKSCRLRISA